MRAASGKRQRSVKHLLLQACRDPHEFKVRIEMLNWLPVVTGELEVRRDQVDLAAGQRIAAGIPRVGQLRACQLGMPAAVEVEAASVLQEDAVGVPVRQPTESLARQVHESREGPPLIDPRPARAERR